MVRRLGAVLAATVVVAALTAGFGGSAGAQTPSAFSCSFSVTPTNLPATGGTVTVSGVAPGSTVVRVFLDGVLVATTTSAPVTGAFTVTLVITASGEITVALDGYPSTPCIGVGGEQVERAVQVAGSSAARLPTTGANETRPIVLVGLTALSLGTVLVVATRRRTRVHGRS